MSLFDNEPDPSVPTLSTKRLPHAVAGAPLAERMRPRTLDEFCGQKHLLGPGKPLRVQIERDDAGSMIFWGPRRGQNHPRQDHRRNYARELH